ncbi:MAG: GH25 family lysozyme [Bacteroidota bacterium]|nr:GH25 family lysozyme [Bacteroidota bacterium]
MNKIKVAILLLLCVGGILAYGKREKKTKRKPDSPIIGIDVSKHTGVINWEKLKTQGVDFAYVKSTEGADYIDPRYEYNFKEAKEVGIPVGAYHFFRFHRTGEEQANNFLSQVNLKKLDLPPVVDVEEWGQYNTTKSADDITREIKDFIDEVEDHSSRSVVIYSDKNSYRKYVEGKFPKNRIWICSIGTPPQIDRDWTLWQQSHDGKFKGAPGKVDVNLFNGNFKAWKKFMKN